MSDDQKSDTLLRQARQLLDSSPLESEALCNQLLEEKVDEHNALLCKGLAILKQGRPEEAGDFFMGCGVDVAEVYVNAASAYRQAGNEPSEIKALVKLLSFRSTRYESSYKRLADWAQKKKDWLLAREVLLMLFSINSDDFTISYSLANACRELRHYKEAITYYLKSMELMEDERQIGGVHSMIAGAYKDIGCQIAARRQFEASYQKAPSTSSASNLIMHMQYMHGVGLREFYGQCREYSARFLRPKRRFQHAQSRLDPAYAETGLRIGLVSGDFVAHSLTHLMLEPIRRLKAVGQQHTYICYCSREEEREDDWTGKYEEVVDIWRNIHSLSDYEAAELIEQDQVDILVDLAGHTAYNRLAVFGYKPAPVQAGWISGMMTPSAVETINYFFTDQWMRPLSADEICEETLINLPAAYSYFPMAEPPSVGPLPADRKGYVTFCSLNNPCKISHAVLDLWARVLKEVPGSRMQIKVYGRDHERKLSQDLQKRGIDATRLEFLYAFPSTRAVMEHYTREVDVVLDTFPCTGCLTSAEAMWMGVPVMTLIGETFLHRQTWTLINQIELQEELGAETAEDFVSRARELSTNRSRLREIRKTLRDRLDMAPVRNPEGIAQGLVRGFEQIWRDWCESREPLKRLVAP